MANAQRWLLAYAVWHGVAAMRPLDDEAEMAAVHEEDEPAAAAAAIQVSANESMVKSRTTGDACLEQARFLNRDMIWGRDDIAKNDLAFMRISMTFESFLQDYGVLHAKLKKLTPAHVQLKNLIAGHKDFKAKLQKIFTDDEAMKLQSSEAERLEHEVLETIKALEPMTEALLALPLKLSLGQKHMFLHSAVGQHFVDYYTVTHPEATVPEDRLDSIVGNNPFEWIREFRRNVAGKFPAKALRKLCAICILSASEPRKTPFTAKWTEGSPIPPELTFYFDEIAKAQAAVDALEKDDAFEAARVPFVPAH